MTMDGSWKTLLAVRARKANSQLAAGRSSQNTKAPSGHKPDHRITALELWKPSRLSIIAQGRSRISAILALAAGVQLAPAVIGTRRPCEIVGSARNSRKVLAYRSYK